MLALPYLHHAAAMLRICMVHSRSMNFSCFNSAYFFLCVSTVILSEACQSISPDEGHMQDLRRQCCGVHARPGLACVNMC